MTQGIMEGSGVAGLRYLLVVGLAERLSLRHEYLHKWKIISIMIIIKSYFWYLNQPCFLENSRNSKYFRII